MGLNQSNERLARHHRLNLGQKLLAHGAFLRRGQLVVREAELLATYQTDGGLRSKSHSPAADLVFPSLPGSGEHRTHPVALLSSDPAKMSSSSKVHEQGVVKTQQPGQAQADLRQYVISKTTMRKLEQILDSLMYRLRKRAFSPKSHSCYLPALRSDSDNSTYVSFVNKAVTRANVFQSFKRHPSYNLILEHVNRELALQYLRHIKANKNITSEQFIRCLKNDLVGNPRTYEFQTDVGSLVASGTTLRYISVASDIARYFDITKINHIAEIGAGYGGQALVLDQIIPNSRILLLDLREVNSLIGKYLQNFVLSGSFTAKTINEIHPGNDYDLVISNYAFCELPHTLQDAYVDKIISRARSGYITMQDIDGRVSSRELAKMMNGFVINEEPESAPKGINKLVIWGDLRETP